MGKLASYYLMNIIRLELAVM
uniref:Uncharacterized protein n=1 Tax=Arundo donax TaxID=35708 RepID=A0A0A8ZVM6_ARUDO